MIHKLTLVIILLQIPIFNLALADTVGPIKPVRYDSYAFSGGGNRALKLWNSGMIATIKIGLNQKHYNKTEPVRLELLIDGEAEVDLYVAMILPDNSFLTFGYPFLSSSPNQAKIYQAKLKISGQLNEPVNINLPLNAELGQYSACGVLVVAGRAPLYTGNWIDFNCAGFEVY